MLNEYRLTYVTGDQGTDTRTDTIRALSYGDAVERFEVEVEANDQNAELVSIEEINSERL